MSDIMSSERGQEAQRKLLRLAADGDDPEIAELASEVLSGRMSMRDLAYTSGYSEILYDRMQPALEIWEGMSESEREDAKANADDLLDAAITELEAVPEAPPPPQAPEPPPADLDDGDHDAFLAQLGWED